MYCITDILKDVFLFNGIPKKDISYFCSLSGCEIISYEKNELMLSANTDKKIGIILDGKATIISADDEVIINKLAVGDIYGVATLFDNPSHQTKVVSASKLTALTLNREFVQSCIEYSSKISINYIEFLAKKIDFFTKYVKKYLQNGQLYGKINIP